MVAAPRQRVVATPSATGWSAPWTHQPRPRRPAHHPQVRKFADPKCGQTVNRTGDQRDGVVGAQRLDGPSARQMRHLVRLFHPTHSNQGEGERESQPKRRRMVGRVHAAGPFERVAAEAVGTVDIAKPQFGVAEHRRRMRGQPDPSAWAKGSRANSLNGSARHSVNARCSADLVPSGLSGQAA